MGRSFYDVSHGALPNGGGFTTPEWNRAQLTIISSANALEVAVSGALKAAVTGIMGAPAVTALSATYASLTSSIY